MSKRGLTPVRVRRRQSDAKWRASVASCYDTLKFVIPDAHKLSKKKVSKALILQETERHINQLEYTLSELFNRKAQECGKTVLWKDDDKFHPASVEDIKTDFEEKQAEIFSQSSQGRRRYHLLSDIEDQIVDMTVNFDKLAIVTRIGNMVIQTNRARVKKKACTSTVVSGCDWTDSGSHALLDAHMIPLAGEKKHVDMLMIQNNQEVPTHKTPEKSHPALNNNSDPSMAALSDDFLNSPICISESDVMLTSPKLAKVTKQLNFTSSLESSNDLLKESTPLKTASLSLGFTPVKLPSEPEEEEEETHNETEDNLLCLETFDTDDSCELQAEKTPDSKTYKETSLLHNSPDKIFCKRKLTMEIELPRHRREKGYIPKCRRQLEKSFTAEPVIRDEHLPIINGIFDKDSAECSDFDGYFLFYRQMANQLESHMSRSEIESPSVAAMVSGIWNTMSKEDKNTLATLARIENNQECTSSQSSLSDDLQELDVKPFHSEYKNKVEVEYIEEYNRHHDKSIQLDIENCGLQLVPDDFDLGVRPLPDTDLHSFTKLHDIKITSDMLEECGYQVIHDIQVVPEFL